MEALSVSSVVLFDGECSLCNHSVQFILRHDPARRFHFASLQSPAGQRLLLQVGQDPARLPESIVLLENGKVYTKSTAALRIARRLRGVWPLAAVFLLVPALLRDGMYDLVARHRYRIFGRQTTCMLPTDASKERFLWE